MPQTLTPIGLGRDYGMMMQIGERDSPHEVFDPWVRWDLGLDRIRSFRVVVVC